MTCLWSPRGMAGSRTVPCALSHSKRRQNSELIVTQILAKDEKMSAFPISSFLCFAHSCPSSSKPLWSLPKHICLQANSGNPAAEGKPVGDGSRPTG